jgi:hypothetical protein
MTSIYDRLDRKPFGSHYRYFETTIARSVEDVWPHALNIGSWMTDHRLVPLAGEPGKVGYFEQVFAGGVGKDVPPPHHHFYGIAEVVPLKYIALEVFPEVGGSYGDPQQWIGFDGILLIDVGGSTKVVVLLLVVNPEKPEDKAPQSHETDAREDATAIQLNRYFDNLKRLAEATP